MQKKKEKKLLIIGGTGFIGHHLLKEAVKLGWKCFSISRNKPQKKRKVKNVNYLLIDIKKTKKLTNINFNYDYIVNLCDISNKLLNTLSEKKLSKFLHIGTSAEYGNLKKIPHKENSTCKPISSYGRKKLIITKNLLKRFQIKFFPLIILRLFQVYGLNDNSNKIIPFVIKNCLKNKSFEVTHGFQTRDFCHINDITRAVIMFLKSNKKKIFGNIYNIGSGQDIDIKSLIIKIENKIGKGRPIFGKKKLSKQEIIYSKSSISKVKDHINWYPKISLDEGIIELINNEK